MVPVVVERSLRDAPVAGAVLLAEIKAALKARSHFGLEEQEGLYIRFENENQVLYRCKLRRPTFAAGRTDFDSHLVTNSVKNESHET